MKPAKKTQSGARPRQTKARESVGKLTLREIVETKDGYSWNTFLVQGWRTADGAHGRKKFKTRTAAEAFIATKSVEMTNAETSLNNVVTRLSKTQVEEAEAAIHRLGRQYTLSQAVEYFLRHFAQPQTPVKLDEARDLFFEARRREGVRSTSFNEMRSTLGMFIAFMTLRAVPDQLRFEIERVRCEIEAERTPSIKELILVLDVALRPAVRQAVDGVGSVTVLFQRKLEPSMRDALAGARDKLLVRRTVTERDIAAFMIATIPGVTVPSVHEVTTDDVEAFLRTLRSKSGGTATRKSWNNARAVIHSFLAWCCSKQRRWCAENAAAGITKFKVARGVPHVLTVAQATELMSYVASYKGGALAKYFALALFAGLRSGTPHGEIAKLSRHPDREKLLDLARRVIHVQPEISKTGQYRQTTIRPALYEWLSRFEGEIWPANGERMAKHIRKRFGLPHDVLRHSFFSYLVSVEGSVERAALEGGNTEGILRRHYLNLANTYEGEAFWKIFPPPLAVKSQEEALANAVETTSTTNPWLVSTLLPRSEIESRS